MLVDMIATVVL